MVLSHSVKAELDWELWDSEARAKPCANSPHSVRVLMACCMLKDSQQDNALQKDVFCSFRVSGFIVVADLCL